MANTEWHSISKEGLPQNSGWYFISIHDSDWVSGEDWIPESEWSHGSAMDYTGIAHYTTPKDSPSKSYFWAQIKILTPNWDELCHSLNNTCCIERKTKPGTWDSDIVAWAPMPLLDSPYREEC